MVDNIQDQGPSTSGDSDIFDETEDLQNVRNRILDAVTIVFLILISPLVLTAYRRALEFDLSLIIVYAQSIVLVIFLLLFIFRKHIPFRLRAIMFLEGLVIISFAGVAQVGLLAGGLYFILMIVVLATILFNAKIAAQITIVNLAIFFFIGIMAITGRLIFRIDANELMVSPTQWFGFFFLYAVVWFVSIAALGRFFVALKESIGFKLTQFAVDNSNDGVFFIESDGGFVYANKRTSEYLGYTNKELLNMKVYDINPSQTVESWADVWSDLRKTGARQFESFHRAKDGHLIPVEVNGSYLNYGKKEFICAFVRDNTERKKVEMELHSYREELEELVESRTKEVIAGQKKFQEMIMNLDEGFYSSTLDGKILQHNPAFNKIAGFNVDEDLVGKTAHDFWKDPKDREKYVEELMKNDLVTDYIIEGKKKSGDSVIVQMQAHIVKDEKGNPMRIDGTFLDITDRKKMEDSIQVSLNEKSILLQEIHHRVKNNMQIMVSLMNLHSKKFKEEGTKDLMLDLENRIRSMSLVHEELYQSPSLAEIPFDEYVKKLSTNLINAFCAPGEVPKLVFNIDDIQLGLDESVPLGLLLNELITNSLKHGSTCEEEGLLTIDMHKEGDVLILVVADNGEGIDQSIDIENTDTLGLRLIDMLTKQLRAEVELERGIGTKFTIKLPMASKYEKRL